MKICEINLFNKMSPIKIMFFILRNSKCRNCGSKKVGNGEGTFILTENKFERTCKCGESIKTASFVSHNKKKKK